MGHAGELLLHGGARRREAMRAAGVGHEEAARPAAAAVDVHNRAPGAHAGRPPSYEPEAATVRSAEPSSSSVRTAVASARSVSAISPAGTTVTSAVRERAAPRREASAAEAGGRSTVPVPVTVIGPSTRT